MENQPGISESVIGKTYTTRGKRKGNRWLDDRYILQGNGHRTMAFVQNVQH